MINMVVYILSRMYILRRILIINDTKLITPAWMHVLEYRSISFELI
jgi:hypothetical protein